MAEKKKVLFIIDSLSCGGAEKSLVSLLPLLDYNRMEIDLIMFNQNGVFQQYLPDQVHIKSLPAISGIHKLWFGICRFFFTLMLRFYSLRGIKRHGAETRWMTMKSAYPKLEDKYDAAISYQQGFPTYYLASKVIAEKKLAWINVDILKAGYRENFNRSFYDKMDYVIPVSDILYQMLQKTGFADERKLRTVYDIINVGLINKMSKERGFDDILPKGTWRILTVGRMAPQKNYPLAVNTARLLKENGLPFHWYFIGDGDDYDKVKNLIESSGLREEITLLGMKSNPYPYMAGCDIYVQTSLFEGFCLTLCEARLLHKPEVSTNFTVVHNQLKDGENGLIAEMTPESLCNKILALTNDPNLRKHIIENTYMEVNNTAFTESAKVNSLILD